MLCNFASCRVASYYYRFDDACPYDVLLDSIDSIDYVDTIDSTILYYYPDSRTGMQAAGLLLSRPPRRLPGRPRTSSLFGLHLRLLPFHVVCILCYSILYYTILYDNTIYVCLCLSVYSCVCFCCWFGLLFMIIGSYDCPYGSHAEINGWIYPGGAGQFESRPILRSAWIVARQDLAPT